MAITIIVKKGRSDVRRFARSAPAHTPAGMEEHELRDYAEKAKIHEELKRARGSSRRKDTDVERIGTGPASHYFDMRKKGIKISDKVLRDEAKRFRRFS